MIFIDTPFVDEHGKRFYAFHGSESEEAGGIGSNGSIGVPDGIYEYCVGVWDRNNGGTYADDPSMIVGTGLLRLQAVLGKLPAADKLLKRAGSAPSPKSKEIQAIEANLQQLIKSLRSLSK